MEIQQFDLQLNIEYKRNKLNRIYRSLCMMTLLVQVKNPYLATGTPYDHCKLFHL